MNVDGGMGNVEIVGKKLSFLHRHKKFSLFIQGFVCIKLQVIEPEIIVGFLPFRMHVL
jgi:hypothetical protein